MSVYTVEKYILYGKQLRWRVLRDGQPLSRDIDWCANSLPTKQSAQEKAAKMAAWDEWQVLMYADDASGKYHWTEGELKQIAEYAVALRVNPLRWTFNGQFPLRKIARIQHLKDAEKLLKDDGCWTDARSVRAETRRVMAARVKAFCDAGLRLKRKESL
jgi:hypothetical protein